MKWQTKYYEYQNQVLESNAEQKKIWDQQLSVADAALVEAKRAESVARTDVERMRKQVTKLQRDARDAESQWRARCGELAVRCKELLDRAEPAIRFCAKLTDKGR